MNDRLVHELGAKADPDVDTISVDNQPLQFEKKFHYFAYYKPRGVVVTKGESWGKPTVFKQLNLPNAVNSVGRLDKDSEGLLLLTDDGDFLQHYTHPSHQVPKLYHVQPSRELSPDEKQKLLSGIALEEKKVRASKVSSFTAQGQAWLELELKEGVKREIRRMLDALGVKVQRLIRVQHGKVHLKGLKPGEWVELPERPK